MSEILEQENEPKYIEIYIQETGDLSRIVKNFELYKGQYIDYYIDIYVPITLSPSEEGRGVAVSTALMYTKRNGALRTTIGYNALFKESGVVKYGRTYDVYEQRIPQEYVKHLGEQTLIANINEIDTTTDPAEFVEIITSQTCPLVIQMSDYIDTEEEPDPSQLDLLEAEVNNLIRNKQDKLDTNIQKTFDDGVVTWQDSQTVVGAINNNTAQNELNRQAIDTNTGNITTNTGDIGDIKAEQITQNTNIGANTGQININTQDIANLKAIVGTGETYIGTYTDDLDPNNSGDLATLKPLLNQYVLDHSEQTEVIAGNVIIYIQEISGGTDKNFKFIYSGAVSDWTFYEIPATESATNDTKGIVQGSYDASSTTKKTQVNVISGEIEDIYVIDNNSDHRRLAEYLNTQNTQVETNKTNIATNTDNISTISGKVGTLETTTTNILNGTTPVGKATSADNDGLNRNIVNTYLTQTAGVTKVQLKEYALPRAFNDVSYLTSTGYSDTVPTSASPVYTATSESVGDTELFEAEKTIVNAEFQLGAKNSSVDTIYVSASEICTVQFRLTTEVDVDNTWHTASVELSDNVNFTTANEIKKLQFGSTFTQLSDILEVVENDKIRQTLEVVTNTSQSITFNVYSNETYPSTFYLNTTSQTIEVAQGNLGEILEFELNGTYNNVDDTIEYEIPEGIIINNNVMAQFLLGIPTVILPDEITDSTSIVLKQGLQEISIFTVPTDLDGRTVPTIHDMASVTTSNTMFFTGVFVIANGDIYLLTSVTAGGSGGTVDYLDLINKPTLDTTQTTAQTTSASETITGNIKLHKISKTGTLADAIDDSTHRLVTDTQISTWGGKQDLIDNSHKLSADLVDDTSTTNKFVTSTDITNWNGKQNALDTTQLDAVNSGIDSTKVGQIATNTSNISTIDGKIPAQASSSNQLADKSFVNSSVQTATANFRGNWSTWSAVPTTASDYPADYAGSKTPTVNDYLVVQDASGYTGTALTGTWRFKYTGEWATDGKSGWLPEYQVNETPLTSAQLDALNSGITSTSVSQIGTNTTNISNKMDKTNPSGTGSLSINRMAGSTTGSYSVSVGYENNASGTSSYAEGMTTQSSGTASHTEGFCSEASADYAHAEGDTSIASGTASHAEGTHTTANHKSQHTFGEYNILDTSLNASSSRGNYVEIVGNGTSSSRSNARTLDWSGNEVLAGGLKINGTNDVITADDLVSTTNVTPLANYYTKSETDSGFAEVDASNLSSANVDSWKEKLQETIQNNFKYDNQWQDAVSMNDCSTLEAIVTLQRANPHKQLSGAVGNFDNNNLKNLLGNPSGFANYSYVYTTGMLFIDKLVVHMYCIGLFAQKLAEAYVWYDGTSWTWTGWKILK